MRVRRFLLYFISFAICILLAVRAKTCMEAAMSALMLCGKTVIPTLFPFFVLSSFMVNTGFVRAAGRLTAPVSKAVFSVSGSGAVVFLMGLLCGYPTGAKMVAELYETKQIDKNEALRLLPFCNNSGPLFVIGAVGSMAASQRVGILLYMIHAVSAVLTGILFSFFSKQKYRLETFAIHTKSIGEAFSESVSHAVETILNVCGFIVFFSVLRSFLLPVIERMFGNGLIALFLSGLAEVTLGAESICVSGLDETKSFVMLAAIIGFGGVCVLFQVCGVVSRVGLTAKTYLLGKVFQMGLSGVLALSVTKTESVFAVIGSLPHVTAEPMPFFLMSMLGVCVCVFLRRRRN